MFLTIIWRKINFMEKNGCDKYCGEHIESTNLRDALMYIDF